MRETGYAKINLALHVRRRRDDGYHEIETLFAFVDAGDVLTALPAERDELTMVGEFASQLTDPFSNIAAQALAKLPLEFSPGEAWNYSVSTDVCGYLVQKIAGKPLDAVFRERIFEPLGMTDTGFFVREDQRERFAACYNSTPAGGLKLQDDPQASPYLAPPKLLSGGGGLVEQITGLLRRAPL